MTKHILISGKVQGVFYRASAKDVANQLKISGWIRNLANGNVEARISGNEEDVNRFINWCHSGPRKAHVDEVQIHDIPDEPFDSFQVR